MKPGFWTALIDRVREGRAREVVAYAPTLVVHPDRESATQLADRLRRQGGLEVEVATSCWAAKTAMQVRFYGSLVCFISPHRASDLECVSTLRIRSGRSWIILVSSVPSTDSRHLMTRYGVDAVLTDPHSTEDLVRRIATFSRRSRPIY